ncbi:MAG: NAD-dependent dihydropyrimidine dehydrogenase subunit PreA [Deltaproteobacteria bacterium]|nr:NAD-dependent dihydropyrimidine dehydrogenase subunit PreA [Deltaproteobacteria bacterium]
MTTLAVDFLGFHLQNPFILASAPPTNTVEMIARAFERGWAGAVTKTIPLEKVPVVNTTPRIHSIAFAGFEEEARRVYAFGNIELVSEKHADYWMAGITKLRRDFPDRFLMASIMADAGAKDDWVELATRAEKAGACALELNFSCPHGGMPPHAVGAAIGQDPTIAKRIVGWVRAAVKIPIVVKLTAAVTDLRQLGQTLIEAGADGFCTINSFPVILGVDLKTHSPLPSVSGKGNVGGLTGRALKPIALRATSEIAPLGKPVSGCGGISTWEDAAEFVLLGASTLQVCSAVMLEGYDVITDLKDGLLSYLEENGATQLSELCGKALKNVVPHSALDVRTRRVSAVDLSTCSRCGKCAIACRDAGYQAITDGADRTPMVDRDKCDGCGLCVQVCPVWECITLAERPAARA